MSSTAPADQLARDQVVQRLGQRTVVVAGAGSGKTTVLVQRVAAELRNGLDPRHLVVITFTDKAARELIHRIRREVPSGTALDEAYIGTIHGWCATLLRSHPIEAGLPPLFRSVDEINADAAALEAAQQVVRAMLDRALTDADLAGAIDVLTELNKAKDLVSLTVELDRQWDQLDRCVVRPAAQPVAAALRRLPELATLRDMAASSAGRSDDELARMVREVVELHDSAIAAPSLADARRLLATAVARKPGNKGKALHWKPTPWDPAEARANLKACSAASLAVVDDECLRRVLDVLTPLVIDAAHARLRRGEVNFDDLLVLARQLVRDHPEVRDELLGRYRQIYVDEFQDTDLVQFDTVAALCDPSVPGHATLFAVGDPKQAIYGFRGARPELFQELAHAAEGDGCRFDLTTNFRSRQPVAHWINRSMAARFTGAGVEFQSPYQELVAKRAGEPDDSGPPITLLGAVINELGQLTLAVSPDAAQAAVHEAADIATAVRDVVDHGWLVHDGQHGGSRPARWSDIAVLVRGRGVLAQLDASFRQAEIPYHVEGGTLVYESREVYELLRVARAVERFDDAKTVVTALRTNVLGVSDHELFRFRQVFRHWSVPSDERIEQLGAAADPAALAVVDALRRLRRWHLRKHTLSPAQLLAEIYDHTFGAPGALLDSPSHAADVWRRVRFVIDEARQWSDSTAGTLRQYLAWVDTRIDRIERADISTDEHDDSVRIMTIHAAKGLEFPVVVVAALGRGDAPERQIAVRVVNDRVEARLGVLATANARVHDFADLAHAEEARLLYVATTRAEDHLVVALHTSKRVVDKSAVGRLLKHVSTEPDVAVGQQAELTELLLDTDDIDALLHTPADPSGLPVLARPPAGERRIWTPSALASHAGDAAARESLEDPDDIAPRLAPPRPSAGGGGPADPGLRKDPPDGRLHERSPGRYGTSVGIAVHAVLQSVPLDHPTADLEARVRRCCADADVTDVTAVEQLSRSIIRAPLFSTFRTAARHRREIYVGTTLGTGDRQRVLWGYVDAAYEAPDGSLVVIDFKTDSHTVTAHELADRYRLQMSGYAVALARATGRTVSAAYLLVGRRSGRDALEVPVELVGADELTDLLAAGPIHPVQS